MEASYGQLQFELELIDRAKDGDPQAGEEILKAIVRHIDGRRIDSPLFPFLAECLYEYERGVPIERALCIEKEPNVGGRPSKYNDIEIAALEILLRRELGYSSGKSVNWVSDNVGIHRSEVRRIRKEFDSRFNDCVKSPDETLMDGSETEILFYSLGSLRKDVSWVFDEAKTRKT